MEACPSPVEGCRYADSEYCLITTHHLYWPRRDYVTPLEKHFRQLPENKERLPRCEHDTVHFEQVAPAKPELLVMRDAITAERERRRG